MTDTTTIDSYRELKRDGNVLLDLGQLPAGKYIYHFTIINPYASKFSFDAWLPDTAVSPVQISGVGKINNYRLSFTHQPAEVDDSVRVKFAFGSGQKIFIKPSGCPKASDIMDKNAPIPLIHDAINNAFIEEPIEREIAMERYAHKHIYLQTFSEVRHQNELLSRQANATAAPIAFEFIDLPTAEKQLDYVVYSKLFAGTRGNIFKRIIRKVLGFCFRGFYRLLTSSKKMKTYVAKLYRNYVNLNYLSERKK